MDHIPDPREPMRDSQSVAAGSTIPEIQTGFLPSRYRYISGRTRAQWVIVCLWLTIAVRTLCMANALLSIHFVQQTARGIEYADQELSLMDISVMVLNVLVIGIQAATVSAFLFWIYRAHSNLPALGAENLDYSPGWAVGYFFIPILNLFRPYQVMSEIWRGSNPALYSTTIGKILRSSSSLVGWWWGMFLIMSYLNNVVSLRFTRHINTDEDFINACYFSAFSYLVISLAATITIKLVRNIEDNQEERHVLIIRQSAIQS